MAPHSVLEPLSKRIMTPGEHILDSLLAKLPCLSFHKLSYWQRRYQYLTKVFGEVVGQLEMHLLHLVLDKKKNAHKDAHHIDIFYLELVGSTYYPDTLIQLE